VFVYLSKNFELFSHPGQQLLEEKVTNINPGEGSITQLLNALVVIENQSLYQLLVPESYKFV
jgi:hypothetical protein